MMMNMKHVSIQVFIYTTIFSVSYCEDVQQIELFFNSRNCDELPRRISQQKEYTLTWYGETEPKLCQFSFTGGDNSESSTDYQVCFESVGFNLPHFDMELLIQNKSSKWEFGGYSGRIEETCVRQANNMMFKIVLDDNYKTLPSYVLKLKLTARKLPKEDEGAFAAALKVLEKTVGPIIPFAVIAIVVICLCRTKHAREFRSLIRAKCKGNSSSGDSSSNNENGSVVSPTYNENQQPEISEFTRLPDSIDPSDQQHIEMTKKPSSEFTTSPPSYEEVQKMAV